MQWDQTELTMPSKTIWNGPVSEPYGCEAGEVGVHEEHFLFCDWVGAKIVLVNIADKTKNQECEANRINSYHIFNVICVKNAYKYESKACLV